MNRKKREIPLLEDIQIDNGKLPLYYPHWESLVDRALAIRQAIASPIEEGGLELTPTQYENTQRGIETINLKVDYKQWLTEKGLVGIDEWLRHIQAIINLQTRGAKPLKRLRIAESKYGGIYYYGSFWYDTIEIRINMGFFEKIKGSGEFARRQRSSLIPGTRDYGLLIEQLPIEVFAEPR